MQLKYDKEKIEIFLHSLCILAFYKIFLSLFMNLLKVKRF